jgi:hypothetical protein
MKKQVAALVMQMGGSPHYSGWDNTMYILAANYNDIEAKITETFGINLPFKIEQTYAMESGK